MWNIQRPPGGRIYSREGLVERFEFCGHRSWRERAIWPRLALGLGAKPKKGCGVVSKYESGHVVAFDLPSLQVVVVMVDGWLMMRTLHVIETLGLCSLPWNGTVGTLGPLASWTLSTNFDQNVFTVAVRKSCPTGPFSNADSQNVEMLYILDCIEIQRDHRTLSMYEEFIYLCRTSVPRTAGRDR